MAFLGQHKGNLKGMVQVFFYVVNILLQYARYVKLTFRNK
jgi:hypothetical protein